MLEQERTLAVELYYVPRFTTPADDPSAIESSNSMLVDTKTTNRSVCIEAVYCAALVLRRTIVLCTPTFVTTLYPEAILNEVTCSLSSGKRFNAWLSIFIGKL